jgi:undecaprenyl-diphosphatase
MLSSVYVLAIIMGAVEGFTEFLPISSTGHLILADEILGFQGPPGRVFEIVIQLGAILAVCWAFRGRIIEAVAGLATEPRQQRFAGNIIIAFLPAAVIGVFAHNFIKSVLFSPWVVAIAFIVGGILILIVERIRPEPRVEEIDELRLRDALAIGFCQCLAMIPGVSRSGATIMGALMFRVDRAPATYFSFFLAIPTMLGATVYDLYKNRDALSGNDLSIIAVGFIAAFIFALPVVHGLVRFISRHGFGLFAWYRIAAGLIALAALIYLR